jgi:hypothetical protein
LTSQVEEKPIPKLSPKRRIIEETSEIFAELADESRKKRTYFRDYAHIKRTLTRIGGVFALPYKTAHTSIHQAF